MVSIPILKTCNRCSRELPLDSFHRDASITSGYRGTCKRCVSERGSAYGQTLAGRLNVYRKCANERGLAFKLTREEAYALLCGDCHWCGRAGYGIDRVDSSQGYIRNNVVSCCTACNQAKSHFTPEQFIENCVAVARHAARF